MNKIYGMVGYTILTHYNKKVLVIADMHDVMKPCPEKYVTIGNWMKEKFNTSDILLEEIERSEDNIIKELWASSDHTQELKNLYLENKDTIIPIDIRHNFIYYSWRLFNPNEKTHCIKMYEYLELINSFFTLQNKNLKEKLEYYKPCVLKNTILGNYYLQIKNKYKQFINNNINNLKKNMGDLNRDNIFEEFDDILDNILEWYTIYNTIYSKKNSIIVHTGLAHSEQIVNILKNLFHFNVYHEEGTNRLIDINENNIKSCFRLPTSMHSQFGGYYNE